VTGQTAQAHPPSPARRTGSRRSRRLVRVGCIPATLLLTACLLPLFNLVTLQRAPLWVSNPREYLANQWMLRTLIMLAVIQLLGTWGLGLATASSGTVAARGQGSWLRPRLQIARRRTLVFALALALVRLILLLVIALAVVWNYVPLFGVRLDWFDLSDLWKAFKVFPIWVAGALVSGLLYWIVGPFLRLWYSSALGALAATWSKQRQEQVWLAFSARLGAGLAGVLALLWGGALITLIILSIFDPHYSTQSVYPDLFPHQPHYIAQIIGAALVILIWVTLCTTGQLVLPEVFIWQAKRRLAARED
jgi:hypothetical protein